MSDENKIRDTADAVKGIVEAVPVYQDVLQPAAQEVGKGLQTVVKLVHVALAPVSMVVWGYEHIRDYLNETLSEKLKKVPPEQIVPPKLTIAGPTVEQLRFAADEPSLRELYANLLATSMNSKTAPEAHPSFVDIIRQLSSDEALILLYMTKGGRFQTYPLLSCKYKIEFEKISYGSTFTRLCMIGEEAGCHSPDQIQTYIDNLVRLGLVEVQNKDDTSAAPFLSYFDLKAKVSDMAFEEVQERYKKQGVEMPKPKYYYSDEVKELALQLTFLGKQFSKACIMEGTHA